MKKLFTILFAFTLSWTSLNAANYSLEFDGTNDYVDMGDNLDNLEDFSLESWIYLDNNGTNKVIVRKDGAFTFMLLDNNKLHLNVGNDMRTWVDDGSATTADAILTGQWVHVAATRESTTGNLILYINGVQAGTGNDYAGSTGNLEFPLRIGANGQDAEYFDGKIDEVRIWGDVRSAQEITENMNKELDGDEDNLLAYYAFNTISGTTLSDDSTNNYTGTLVNLDASSALLQSSTVNLVTKRLLFDGVDDYIDLGDTFEGVDAFTVAAWVKWDGNWDDKYYEAVVHKDLSFGAGLRNPAQNGGPAAWHTHVIGSNVILDSATAITPNTWVHVATTRDAAGTMKMYIDGVLDAPTINTTFTSVNNNNSLYIGQRDESGTIDAHFNGNIAGVAFFTKELNSTEINALKNTTLIGTEAGLFASYPLNEQRGDVAKDSSSAQNEGTIYGATWEISDLNNTDIFVKEGATSIYQFFASADSWGMPLYSVDAGADTGKFTIDSATGELTFSNASYYNTHASYDVNVTATSADGTYSDSVVYRVIVRMIPEITNSNLTTITFNENTTGTVVDIDANNTISYSISGTDADKFNIESASGIITFKTLPDFENPIDSDANNIYDFNVTASGNDTNDTRAVVVTVVDTNETQVALTKIENFAENNSNPAPTVQDYIDAGITGVDANNLAAVNAAVDATDGDGADTVAEIQYLVPVCIGSTNSSGNIFDLNEVDNNELYFHNKTYISGDGRGEGDIVRFDNVVTIDGQSVDAVVTTTDDSADIATYDSTYRPTSNSKFFQPLFGGNSGNKYATFSIKFYKSGTYTGVGTGELVTLKNLYVNSYDIDAKQYQVFRGFTSYSLGSNTVFDDTDGTITVEADGSVKFEELNGQNGSGTEDKYRVRVFYDSISEFIFTTGDRDGGSSYFALDFSQGEGWHSIPSDTESISAKLIYSSKIFTEKIQNDGSIDNNITIDLQNGDGLTFDNVSLGCSVVLNNVPAGLSANVTKVNDTQVVVALSGNATEHPNANDINNLEIIFGDGAFSNRNRVVVTNYEKRDIEVNFIDNQAPVINSSGFAISENSAINSVIGALSVSDEDDTSFTYEIVSGNSDNTFALSSTTGAITLLKTLDAYVKENYTFGVKVSDDDGAFDTTDVTITITNENDAPVAVADTSTIDEDNNATINLVTNDTDADHNINSASIVITKSPDNGSVRVSSSGVATYTPNENYNGSDYFTYKVYDGTALVSNEANVTVTINAINDAPIAQSTTWHTNEDENVSHDLNFYASDVEDDALTFTIDSTTSNGTLTLGSDGNISYVPKNNYYGIDSFTYHSEDANTVSETRTISINIAEINDVPVAYGDSATTVEDGGAITIDVLANDIDDGDLNTSSIEISKEPLHGTVIVVNGEAVYEADENYYGTDSFEYTVKDDGLVTASLGSTGVLISNSALVTITISSLNDAPVAVADSFTLDEDSVYLMNLHLNDTDVDSDLNGTAITIVSNPSDGNVSLLSNGLVRYIPNKDYNGVDSFTYKISDGDINSSTATVSLSISAVNDTPIISGTPTTSIDKDTLYSFTPTGADVDTGDTLTYSILNQPTWADFNTTTGELWGTPRNNDVGVTSNIVISVKDDENATASLAVFDITVTNIALENALAKIEAYAQDNTNPAPTVQDYIDAGITGVNANNLDAVNAELNAIDGGGADTVEEIQALADINHAPEFNSTPLTDATEYSEYNYELNASDVDGDNLSYSSVNLPSWLSISNTGATIETLADISSEAYSMAFDENDNLYVALRYENKIIKITPDGTVSDFLTNQSLVWSVKYYDGDLYFLPYYSKLKKVDLVSKDITEVTQDWFYSDDFEFDNDGNLYITKNNLGVWKYTKSSNYTSSEELVSASEISDVGGIEYHDGALYISDQSNYAIQKYDIDSDTLSVIAGNNGKDRQNYEKVSALDAQFYEPAKLLFDSSGVLYIIDYFNTVRTLDSDGYINSFEDFNYLNGRALAINSKGEIYAVGTSSNKIVKIVNSNKILTGTPTVSGVYDVNLTVTDGDLNGTQNFQITVADVNDAPILNDSGFVVSENDATLTVVGLVEASDEDGISPSVDLIGSAEVLTYSIESGNTNNDFAINSTTGEISVANPLNAYTTQTYSLSVKAEDDGGASDTATVTISISDEADVPLAVDDTSTIDEDNNATINLVTNDTDKDNNINIGSVVITKQPSNGSVNVNASGVAIYSPNANYYGSDYFTYKVYDATSLQSNEANVTITINAVNDTPVTVNTTLSTDEDVNLTKSLNQYASDVDGDSLTYAIVANGAHGDATLDGTLVTYAPDNNFYGFDTITFTATDGNGSVSNTSTININVAAINDVPVAYLDDANTTEDESVNIDVLANDIDDGNLSASSVTIVNQPANGTVVVEANGTITYTPNANFYGNDSFEYSVKDDGLITDNLGKEGVLVSNSALVTIAISSVNDAPVAVADSFTLDEDSVYLMNLHANDTDVDSDLNGTAITIVTPPSHGEANVTSTGLVRYIPTKDYNGADSFTYKISDGDVNSSEVTVSLSINAVNDAPSLSVLPDIAKITNFTDFNITINAQDVENNALTYSASSSNTSLATVSMNAEVLTISSVNNEFGETTIDVNVSDGNSSIIRSFELTVGAASVANNADGSKTIESTNTDGVTKEITTSLADANVTTDENGTTTIDGTSADSNVSVTLDVYTTQTAVISTNGSSTSVLVPSDLNSTTTIDENGTITTAITNGDSNTTIAQNANGELNATTTNANGETTKLNIASPNNVEVVVNTDGSVTYTTTQVDGSKSVVTLNADGSSTVEVYDASGNLVSRNTYPAGSVIDIDENGTITTEIVNADSNTTIAQNANGEVNATTTNANGETTKVNIGAPNDVEVVVNADGSVTYTTTQADGSKSVVTLNADGSSTVEVYDASGNLVSRNTYPAGTVIDIDENGVVSVEINASTQSGDAITLKLEGNIKTTVDADGVTTIEASDSNITINPNGDINVTTPTGSSIAIPDGSGDVEITQDADGNTQFIITNLDGTTEVTTEVTLKTDGQIEVATSNGGIVIPSGNGDSNITTNENGNTVIENTNPNGATTTIIINDDGTFKVVTKDIDGYLIEDKTYPTNTQITLGDPVEIYYKDENGYWITKHIKSDGTVTTYNSDDTTTISKQKVNGNGDLVTDVTLPQYIDGNVVEQNDGSTTFSITDSEYSYDINITNTGSLDIDTTGANGTHNITVANPGADINISNEGNMTITTPIFTNLDGTTCGYSLDIAYDGSDMITKHTLSNTVDEDIITTIIMRIPNSNVDVTSDNKVVHYGSFTNTANPNKDVNVTATVNCKGEVSTITKISDQNASLIALNKPGSTVIIYTDGAVDAQLPITNVGSDDVKQLKFSVDPNSGDITTQKIFTDNNISEVVYPVGAKVVANNTNIAEVIVDLTNPNIVKVDVKDENNNTITTTTTIDSSFTVNRTSEGEDGKITSEINATGGAKIVIDNFVDGKAKHLVEVNGVSTEATSNIEGADINVTNSGVTTTFEDTNVKAEVTATLDGKAAHKMTTPNGTTEATSHIPGAKTVIDKDANGNPKILTKVSTTNSNSKVVDIEVDASSDGSAVHKITVDGVSSTATSNIVGAKTIIDENGSVETAVGEVADGTTYVIKAKVITDTTGKAITRFVRVNQNDENDLTVLSNTMTVDTKYEAGNEVTIDLIEETLFIKTVAPLTDNLEVE